MKTVFVDIDGTIFKQKANLSEVFEEELELLPGVKESFDNWNWKGYKIVIVTGRKESTRSATELALKKANLFWDHLLMGLDVGGERVIINDSKAESNQTARAFVVDRDKGFDDVLKNL